VLPQRNAIAIQPADRTRGEAPPELIEKASLAHTSIAGDQHRYSAPIERLI
jgi:hypothetical protein